MALHLPNCLRHLADQLYTGGFSLASQMICTKTWGVNDTWISSIYIKKTITGPSSISPLAVCGVELISL
jgi:hypothetical protein